MKQHKYVISAIFLLGFVLLASVDIKISVGVFLMCWSSQELN